MSRLMTQRAIVRGGIGVAVAGLAIAAGTSATAGARVHRSIRAEATPSTSERAAIINHSYAAVSPAAAKIAVTLSGKKTAGLPATLTPGYHTFLLKQKGPNIRDFVVIRITDPAYSAKKLKSDMNSLFGARTFPAKAYKRIITKSVIEGSIPATGAGIVAPQLGLKLKPDATYLFVNTADAGNGADIVTKVTTAGAATGSEPGYTATIKQAEFTFAAAGLHAGTQVVRLRNVGAQLHELAMFLITDPSKTEQDAVDAIMNSGPNDPPPSWLQEGGFGGFHTPKDTEYVKLHLNHGDRLLMVCFMPDPSSQGAPHISRGMHRLVEIS